MYRPKKSAPLAILLASVLKSVIFVFHQQIYTTELKITVWERTEENKTSQVIQHDKVLPLVLENRLCVSTQITLQATRAQNKQCIIYIWWITYFHHQDSKPYQQETMTYTIANLNNQTHTFMHVYMYICTPEILI